MSSWISVEDHAGTSVPGLLMRSKQNRPSPLSEDLAGWLITNLPAIRTLSDLPTQPHPGITKPKEAQQNRTGDRNKSHIAVATC